MHITKNACFSTAQLDLLLEAPSFLHNASCSYNHAALRKACLLYSCCLLWHRYVACSSGPQPHEHARREVVIIRDLHTEEPTALHTA